MFVIKTYVAASKINGVGCFAGQSVKKGTVIKKPIKGLFNLKINLKKLRAPKAVFDFIRHYGVQQDPGGPHHLGLDNVRFMNHSEKPNIAFFGKEKEFVVALRNIKKGEELTCDYRALCSPEEWEIERKRMGKLKR